MILGNINLKIMSGEMDLTTASKIISKVNIAYDKYIPEEHNYLIKK